MLIPVCHQHLRFPLHYQISQSEYEQMDLDPHPQHFQSAHPDGMHQPVPTPKLPLAVGKRTQPDRTVELSDEEVEELPINSRTAKRRRIQP